GVRVSPQGHPVRHLNTAGVREVWFAQDSCRESSRAFVDELAVHQEQRLRRNVGPGPPLARSGGVTEIEGRKQDWDVAPAYGHVDRAPLQLFHIDLLSLPFTGREQRSTHGGVKRTVEREHRVANLFYRHALTVESRP